MFSIKLFKLNSCAVLYRLTYKRRKDFLYFKYKFKYFQWMKMIPLHLDFMKNSLFILHLFASRDCKKTQYTEVGCRISCTIWKIFWTLCHSVDFMSSRLLTYQFISSRYLTSMLQGTRLIAYLTIHPLALLLVSVTNNKNMNGIVFMNLILF